MTQLQIRNWNKWQSYRKDRGQPPWIKIHRTLMRDPNWVELTDAQRGQLVAIWLLAADNDGVVPASAGMIRKLCFMENEPDINLFIKHGFIEPTPSGCHVDANVTPERRQHDAPEKRRGEENREEKKGGASAPSLVVFSGSYAKTVTEKNLAEWGERYWTLDRDDLLSEIALCDEYYSGSEKPSSGNWFFAVSAWLKREHDRRIRIRRDADEREAAIYRGVL